MELLCVLFGTAQRIFVLTTQKGDSGRAWAFWAFFPAVLYRLTASRRLHWGDREKTGLNLFLCTSILLTPARFSHRSDLRHGKGDSERGCRNSSLSLGLSFCLCLSSFLLYLYRLSRAELSHLCTSNGDGSYRAPISLL